MFIFTTKYIFNINQNLFMPVIEFCYELQTVKDNFSLETFIQININHSFSDENV